jgi:hypothetical protein
MRVLPAKCQSDGVERAFRRQNGDPTRSNQHFPGKMAFRRAAEARFVGKMAFRQAAEARFAGKMAVRRVRK